MSKDRKPIPQPMNIVKRKAPAKQPGSLPHDPLEMVLPIALADGPRIFLNFLALHSKIPDVYREKIAIWLLEYRKHCVDYLMNQYGTAGVLYADEIAKKMAEQFLMVVREDYDKAMLAEGELFARLEDELHQGDGGG